MRVIWLYLCLIVWVSSLEAAENIRSQDPLERKTKRSERTMTSLSNVDEDFSFIGEYRGYEWPTGNSRSSRLVGFHVNSLGGGEFTIVKFFGGLPGDSRVSMSQQVLTGRRLHGELFFVSERMKYRLTASGGFVETLSGRAAGKLKRVDRESPSLNAVPPQGAVILFDGTNSELWSKGALTSRRTLKAGAESKFPIDSMWLHVEFRLPYKPDARGQDRGNSGVYIQERYEIQVLDTFGFLPAFNDCGALYRMKRPEICANLPPLTWQTYDIDFKAAQFDGAGEKKENARISVWHNGVLIHHQVEIPKPTGKGRSETPEPRILKLQDHKNPVEFRNIWYLPKNDSGSRQGTL